MLKFVFLFLTASQLLFAESKKCDLDKYQKSLDEVQTLELNFDQYVNEKYYSSGVIYLKKPDKMLIDYNKGEINSIILINGNVITYYDKDLEQFSHLPKKNLPIYEVLKNKIKLSDLQIIKCEKIGNSYQINFLHKDDFFNGEFAFSFDLIDFSLKKISSMQNNEIIALNLKILNKNTEISDKKFIIKNNNL